MFNLGFVGSKGIAVTVAKELAKDKNVKIVGVYSRSFERCQEFSKNFGATPYKNFEDMLEDKRINAIYVATPHRYHYYYCKKALEKHIPVICEKTLTLHYESAKELFELAEKNNTYFVEAMWTWFNPIAYKVRNWVNEKRIGNTKYLKADFSVPSVYANSKIRLTRKDLGGGSLYDLGVYPVTYAYRLFGYPQEIKVLKSKLKNGVDYSLKVEFDYENGTKCYLTSAINKIGLCNLTIKGDKGKIKLPSSFHSARKVKLKSPEGVVVYKDKEPVKLYEREFLIAITEIKEGLINSRFVKKEDTLNVLKILEEIKAQINLIYPDDRK